MEQLSNLTRLEQTPQRLSAQQMRLLVLLCQGHQYKTAAAAMGVSVNTVGFHVRSLYTRLGVHSKTEAVVKAFAAHLWQAPT